jgi:alpha-L-rhamnosidase
MAILSKSQVKQVLFVLFISFLILTLSEKIEGQNIKDWNAQWIMHPSVLPQSAAKILFRKTFDLKEKPTRFVINISADNHYRLFVNGTYITRGPARGDLRHYFYETLDIAPYLNEGKNVLAAEVVNWGAKRSFTVFSQMTSFWLQGEGEKEAIVNTISDKWLCKQNEGHFFTPVDWIFDKKSVVGGLYVVGTTDSIVVQTPLQGWTKQDFDDSNWLRTKWCDVAGGRAKQHAGGILYADGKLLIPRRTDLLQEEKERFNSFIRTEGISLHEDFLKGNKALIIPAHKKVKIWLDHIYMTVGYPEMTVSGGKNAHIQVRYAETLFKTDGLKGDRNDLEGKRFIGIKDVFMPDGGPNRSFQPTYLRNFRFIQLEIETQDDPLSIDSYFNVKCTAPLQLKAKFESNDTALNKLMVAGWRTVHNCAQDMLMSDAYYEQMQYVGDSRVHNLTLMTLSGDDKLTRNALIQFDESRIPEGLTYACYPNAFHLIIPSYSLIFIDQLHDYMLWKDDKAYLKKFDLGIYSVLDWFEKRIQPNGLLGKIEWWPALAWPKGYKNGVPLSMEKGENTLYTLHYVYTLMHAAEIYQFIGNETMAKECLMRAERTRQAIKILCFDSEKQLFKESPTDKTFSQITNILAVLSETVKNDEAKSLMTKVLTDTSLTGKVDLFLHLYLFEGMSKTGTNAAFFTEISEWHTMMQRNLTTFVEVPLEWGEENQRSECHPWSTIPNTYFFKTVCGIKPTSAGHKTIVIEPELGSLKTLKAVYPHHLGNVEIDWVLESNTLRGTIAIPKGMSATFKWKGHILPLKAGEQQVLFKTK